MVGTYDIQPFF